MKDVWLCTCACWRRELFNFLGFQCTFYIRYFSESRRFNWFSRTFQCNSFMCVCSRTLFESFLKVLSWQHYWFWFLYTEYERIEGFFLVEIAKKKHLLCSNHPFNKLALYFVFGVFIFIDQYKFWPRMSHKDIWPSHGNVSSCENVWWILTHVMHVQKLAISV